MSRNRTHAAIRSLCAASLLVAAAAVTLAAPPPDDCGHKTTQHACTGGQTRIRMNLLENVALSELKSTTAPGTPSLLWVDDRDNPTCTTTNETFTWNCSYTNDYKVGAAFSTGIEAEVGVGTPDWYPIAAEAKVKASSGITITGELSRTETFSAGGSSSFSLKCAKRTLKLYLDVQTGTATQDFGNKVFCSTGNAMPDSVWNTCAVRTIKATCHGTTHTTTQYSETSYNCDCPPGQGDS